MNEYSRLNLCVYIVENQYYTSDYLSLYRYIL